jgi:hypothetical protein
LPVETNRGKLRGRLAQSFDLPPQRTATPAHARPPLVRCRLSSLAFVLLLPVVFLSQRHQINVARYGSPLSSSLVNLLKKKGFLVYFLNARFLTGDKKNNVLGWFHNASVIGSLVTLLLVLLL